MAPRVVILGGGQSGAQSALLLKKVGGGSLDVTLVERGPRIVYKPLLTWLAVGKADTSEVVANLDRSSHSNLRLVLGNVESIDVKNKVVRVSGKKLEYDYLIIALGAEPDEGAVKGLAAHNTTAWTLNGAERLRETLRSANGGTVIVGAISPPFPCPPAPFELAGLVKNLRPGNGSFNVKAVTFEEKPLMGLGSEVSDSLVDLLDRTGVELVAGFKVREVDAENRRVVGEDGRALGYDILSLVPPFKPPRPVAGLEIAGPGGWLVTDPYRGFRTRLGDVYAIGDVALPPFGAPMSGFLGAHMAKMAARKILEEAAGITVEVKERAYAECFVDHGEDGIGIYCDFTEVIYGGGKPHCHVFAHGTLVGEYKAALARNWRRTIKNLIGLT